jgi:undecaprenyl phosphate N,N'-diacetylbacillosamine 1-phosphate transferase
MYAKCVKRILDFLLSIIAVVVLSPVYLVLAILVRARLGKPVLFTQERIGKGERPFKLYKFRSMTDQRDEKGNLLPDEVRLTGFGKKLRSTSLDELPELFNIIKGEMSIIGPRPMPMAYLPYYREDERVIHTVRGGLIPPDVLTLHSVFDWDEQFQNEIRYAKNVTFLTDVKIVIAVFLILIKRNENQYGGQVRKPLTEVRKEMKEEMKV